MTSSSDEINRIEKQSLAAIESKLSKVEERFAFGEIDATIFEKVGGKLKDEKRLIERIERRRKHLSNPKEFVSRALKISADLSNFWVFADYDGKRKLQDIVFQGV